MKSLLKSRKLLSLVIGLALVLSAMGMAFAPSSALAAVGGHGGQDPLVNNGQFLEGNAIPPNPSNPNGSTYEVVGEPSSTTPISVTVIFEAGNVLDDEWGETVYGTAFRKEITGVSIGGGVVPNTLNSLLLAINVSGRTFRPGIARVGSPGASKIALLQSQ